MTMEARSDSVRYTPLGWKKSLTPWILCILAVAGWATALVFAFLWDRAMHQPTSLPLLKVSESWMAEFPNGAVAADNGVCSEVGRNILKVGGNAVDAAIAALVCDGNQNPFSMGLGGGFFMVVYNSTTKECTAVDARETAPLWATPDKFQTHPTNGWTSIAVPGELMGYWEAHKKFGSLAWKELWIPGIKLARKGIFVSEPLARIMRHRYVHKYLLREPSMAFYIDSQTNEVYSEGKRLINPILANTLDKLANSEDPVGLFYRGSLAKSLVQEIQKYGGNLTLEDFQSYKVRVYNGWKVELPNSNLTFCSLGMPSGGPAAGLYLQIVDALGMKPADMKTDMDTAATTYHKLLEASKFAYGHWKYFADSNDTSLRKVLEKMKTFAYAKALGDRISAKAFQDIHYYDASMGQPGYTGPLDKGGTAQISLMDKWGNAVSVTSSINWLFGAMRRSPTTGIVWNNHLADFSFDKKGLNSMQPQKRPRSAMSPVIIIQRSDNVPKLVLGAAGGSKIIGAIGYVAARVLYLNETLKFASDAPRFFNRLEQEETQIESSFPKEYITKLKQMGHKFTDMPMLSILQSLQQKNGMIFAHTDYRKQSYPAGY